MAATQIKRLSNRLNSLRLDSRPHTSARSKELSQQNGVALLANQVYIQPARAGGRPAGQEARLHARAVTVCSSYTLPQGAEASGVSLPANRGLQDRLLVLGTRNL